ncbi:FMN-dependent dehydrogenase-domain-containing protein [Xylariomycetidae sp. FL2044]|nr:FMN-dependent dehydrogenase-domain-containing protein [Xylariomycetidae sp. FL2044]
MHTADEIAKHNTVSSCWTVIDGGLYDVTPYLSQHPGGVAILLKQGGRDATIEFRKIHNPDILSYLPKDSFLGPVDRAVASSLRSTARVDTLPANSPMPTDPGLSIANDTSSTTTTKKAPPHISTCITLTDFEAASAAVLPLKDHSYVTSSANDGASLRANLESWTRLTFRPRVLRDVASVSCRTRILGAPSAFPFYVSAMGQLGRSHPGNEKAVVGALARKGCHGMISTESTASTEDIAKTFREQLDGIHISNEEEGGQQPPAQLHFQLYIPSDREIARTRIRRARAAGYASLWVTVDTAALGKRVSDRRLQAAEALEMGLEAEAERAGYGLRAHAPASHFCSSLVWADLAWIRAEFGDGGPVVLKGVQSAEDARLAAEHGCSGILLSNHGGRQAPAAPDALTTLLEIRTYCPEVLDRLEVFVDGGVKDGADVLKAVCLGARAVGVGRPFFHALAAYGARGVERCIDLLAEELILAMKLVGIISLDQARPELVNASRLLNEMWRPERSRL